MNKIASLVLWMASSAILMVLVTLPVNMEAHFVAGVIILAIVAIVKFAKPSGPWRMIVLGLGTAVVFRYVYWRTTSTLPDISQLENFIPGILLYSAEMYAVVMLMLSLFTVLDPLERPPAPIYPDKDLPTVDVFVPSYNEELPLVATTLAAAKAMDYPPEKLNVYLLDDGGTDQKCNDSNPSTAIAARERRAEFSALCEGLGVQYLTRARNQHAKAGNLNNGLAVTSGDLIVVFDADHAPTRNFLKGTVGFFHDDPKLFLVQTPHFFINPDPLERNFDTFSRMPSENEQFYGMVQKGLDKWNASFFCGSAAVIRRAALNETGGGFSGITITEDAETALDLHSRGWNSVYVDRPLIAGLQPDTFASFIVQRSRWAQGMTQILIFKNPLFKRGLSMPQRLSYVASTTFWMFSFARLAFFASPLLYLFFNLQIFVASGSEFAAYSSTYMVVNLLMQSYLFSTVRWPWMSELYEYIQAVFLGRAIVSVMLNPRKPTFAVTTKGETLDYAQISSIGRPFYIIYFVFLLGMVAMVYRLYSDPQNADLTLVVGGWNAFNLIMAGAALGVVSERQNRRRMQRVRVNRNAELITEHGTIMVSIEDASIGGVRLRSAEELPPDVWPGAEFSLRWQPNSEFGMDTLPVILRTRGVDKDGPILGCEANITDPLHYRLIADLIFADADKWYAFQRGRRAQAVGVVRGTLIYLQWAFQQAGRGLLYLWKSRETKRKIAAARAVQVGGA